MPVVGFTVSLFNNLQLIITFSHLHALLSLEVIKQCTTGSVQFVTDGWTFMHWRGNKPSVFPYRFIYAATISKLDNRLLSLPVS